MKEAGSVLAGISSQVGRLSQTALRPAGGGVVGRLDRESVLRGLLAGVVGDEHVAVDGAARGRVHVSPASAEEACEVLKVAFVEGWGVVPAGACSWLGAGNPLRGPLVFVKTERMARVIEHEPADLVATAETGVRLADFNRESGRAGQWLPLDPPDGGGATLGGVAATGLGGAQAFGYGLPRSHVLGMRVALADGKVVRAGGRVVKNVAGYDLCKLFVGSYGTLGLILELTMKLRPRPAREATLLARSTDWRALHAAARAIVSAQLLPVAVELLSEGMAASLDVHGAPGESALLVRFAGNDETVAYQLERAREIVVEHNCAGVEVLTGDADCWSKLSAVAASDEGVVVWRAGVLPSELGAMLSEVEARGDGESKWHAGAGDGRLRVFETKGDAATLASLRKTARAAGGSLVVERAPSELKREFDAWGLRDSTAALMRRVKEQLDPAGLFSPERFSFHA